MSDEKIRLQVPVDVPEGFPEYVEQGYHATELPRGEVIEVEDRLFADWLVREMGLVEEEEETGSGGEGETQVNPTSDASSDAAEDPTSDASSGAGGTPAFPVEGTTTVPAEGATAVSATDVTTDFPEDFPRREVFTGQDVSVEDLRGKSREELIDLPGVGERTADAILEFFENNPSAAADGDMNGGDE